MMRKLSILSLGLAMLFISSSCVTRDQYNDAQYRVDSLVNELYMEQRLNDQLQAYIETIYYQKVEPNWSSSIDLPVGTETAQTLETSALNELPESTTLDELTPNSETKGTTRSNVRVANPKTVQQAAKSTTTKGISAFLLKEEILFGSNSSEIEEESRTILIQIAQALQHRNDYMITIEGHTDNVESTEEGAPSRHWELSTERASSVAKVLISNGIVPHLIRVSGRGMFQPHASNHTPEGREKNRRAEIILSPRKQ